ncbi:hypothetical protein Prudu_022747 [Prunus dulcis]|uniref:Uncharacterized protein n=1 Tax=Prunus dulcis TaxID=3755 RepID=A0A4Y1S263_PRUDU|nr:hypothetical protein Prudu_022747 [Prunus dulcis]
MAVGRDGIEAGTNLVPDSVPRSIARVSVTVVALALSLFVLKFSLCGMKDQRGWRHHLYTEGGGDVGQSRRSQKNHGEV